MNFVIQMIITPLLVDTACSFIVDRYWYQFGCMYPDMGTLWMAVDKTTKENGCVQVSPQKVLYNFDISVQFPGYFFLRILCK